MADIVIAEWMLWIYAMWGILIETLIIIACFLLIPIERRARAMSFIMKKSYGIIEVVGKGGHVSKHMANFWEDYQIVRGGVFFLDPDYVYIKDGARVIHFDEKDAFTPVFIENSDEKIFNELTELSQKELDDVKAGLTKKQLKTLKEFMKGRNIEKLERIFVQPSELKANEAKDAQEEKRRDPQMINAVFLKQKALAESEAVLKVLTVLKWLCVAAAGAALIAAALGYMNYDAIVNMVKGG